MRKTPSLQTRLYITTIVSICLVCVMCMLFIHFQILSRIENDTIDSNQQLCVKISENIDTFVGKVDDISKGLLSNGRLLQILREESWQNEKRSDYEKLTLERELSKIVSDSITLTAFPHVDVYLYDTTGDFSYAYFHDRGKFDEIISKEENKEKLNNKKLVLFPSEEAISFMRAIYDIGMNLHGYIEVQSDYKELEMITNIQGNGCVTVLDSNGQLLYQSGEFSEELSATLEQSFSEKDNISGYLKKDGSIIFYNTSVYTGLTTYISYPLETIYAPINLLYRTIVIFMLVMIVIVVIMATSMLSIFLKPLKDLRNSVLQVTYKNSGVDFDNTSNDEVLQLKDAFQMIINDLKASAVRENAANQAELKSRLEALQAQISPHFIHNVLYLISISAKENRTEDAALMCKQLSNMLRYTVDLASPEVLLENEFECIRNYLALQKNYYEDFLQYSVELEEEAGHLTMPRLCILPFVENAIQHAFEGCVPPYNICVRAGIKGAKWFITIEDNGVGFSEEKKASLEHRIQEEIFTVEASAQEGSQPNVGGLGVVNSVWRMRYYYGSSFTFEILPGEQGRGTNIRLQGEIMN